MSAISGESLGCWQGPWRSKTTTRGRQAISLSCAQIYELLGEKPQFVDGFAVIESSVGLGVVAVYTVASEHGEAATLYTDRVPARRLAEHNGGKSTHTNKLKPWELMTYVAFQEQRAAEKFERYLKSGSGRAFTRRHLLRSEILS
jgi:predicted GIY-YIG superfamily endonuclease